VGSVVMGFDLNEIPAIKLAHEAGMVPGSLGDIEIRGLTIDQTMHRFIRPNVLKWTDINKLWGVKEI
jgi:hypothetical protein